MATQCGRCGKIQLGRDETEGAAIYDVLIYCAECEPIVRPLETVESVLRNMKRLATARAEVRSDLDVRTTEFLQHNIPRLQKAIENLKLCGCKKAGRP